MEGDDRLKVDRPLGGDEADLVDFLHSAGVGAHDGGDGHLDGLAGADLIFIGVAEVQGELQLLVVDQGGHRGLLGHLLVGLELLHVDELAGEGGPDGEVVGVLQQGGHLLIQVVHLGLGLGHLVLGLLAEDGVQGLARGDRVAGGDKDLLHRAAGGEGDGGGFLGLGVAAAGNLALDGAVLDGLGLDLAAGAVLLGQKAVEQKAARRQSHHNRAGNNRLAHLALVELRLGPARRRGRGRGWSGLGNSHFWHGIKSS